MQVKKLYANFGTINRTFYLKSGRRRPVRCGLPLGMVDVQGAIPPGWCDLCGAEAWRGERCRRCGELKVENAI